jgi:hypothetical protein
VTKTKNLKLKTWQKHFGAQTVLARKHFGAQTFLARNHFGALFTNSWFMDKLELSGLNLGRVFNFVVKYTN